MIKFQNLIKRTILDNDNKYFHGISFIIISLIIINVAVYFNFYKFSNEWIKNESQKTTFILSNNANEKVIPEQIISKIEKYLENQNNYLVYNIVTDSLIEESLGIKNIDDTFGLSMPFVFLIETADEQLVDKVYSAILELSENRMIEKYSHKDQLFEVTSMFKRIKLIIFFMFLVMSILFSFLVLNITKAALLGNYKFLEMIQIMGENSFELSKNISLSILKKIIPGSILSIIFVSFITSFLIKMFGANFYFMNENVYLEQTMKTSILLVIFIIVLLLILLIFLMLYLFYFFEKRFFDKI